MPSPLARRTPITRTGGEHRHDFVQLLFGWRGATDCEFQHLGGCVDAGHAAIVPVNTDHRYAGRSDDSELLVIDLAGADPGLDVLEQQCELDVRASLFEEPRVLPMSPTLTSMVAFGIAQVSRSRGTTQERLVNHQLATLFTTLLYQELRPETRTRRDRLSAESLDRLIDRRLANPPCNRELSDALHLGQSQLHLLCQRQFGLTPQQYVLRRRLYWARHWLRHTDRSVSEIALDLGFADGSSFSHAYRRLLGYPPSRERRQD